MKRLIIASTILLLTGACLLAINKSASRSAGALHANQSLWQAQTGQLAEVQAEIARLKSKIDDQERELRRPAAGSAAIEPELATFLSTNDARFASPELQNRLLAAFGRGNISSAGFVLVSKAALANSNLRPLRSFPNNDKLSDAVRGVLVITPEEQQAVEAAFTDAYSDLGTWAKENVQREGPTNEMLAQYAIPASTAVREQITQDLFSKINSAIGNERGELLRKYFESYALYEDAAIGDRTNILAVYRIAAPPGYGSRAGWRWADHSEAINTKPEPIKTNNFPLAFRFVFPGGWPEVARRENFELPPEFDQR